jgi:hypothetical protein
MITTPRSRPAIHRTRAARLPSLISHFAPTIMTTLPRGARLPPLTVETRRAQIVRRRERFPSRRASSRTDAMRSLWSRVFHHCNLARKNSARSSRDVILEALRSSRRVLTRDQAALTSILALASRDGA